MELAAEQLRQRPWQALALEPAIPIDALPSPALLLDAAAFERNLLRMADFLGARGKGFRPHAKTHKCPLIAHRQLALGAAGVCTAKVSEALVMINAGIDRVLVTSPVVTPDKVALLHALAADASQLDVVVDSDLGLELLRSGASPDAPVGVLVDVDVAMGRTGTRDVDRILRLAEGAADTPGLRFRGVQHYAGQVMHVEGYERRRDKSLALWERVAELVEQLSRHGFAPEVVTGGGTGTFDIDCDVDCITDLQVGSYIFMDEEYLRIGGSGSRRFDAFEVSLQVALTAISQPRDGAITVDGGYKAFASDSVEPVPLDLPSVRFRFAGDEHGVLILEPGAQEPLLGSRQRFVVPHCDPTVNLYDYYWVCEDGLATSVWPIAARGCSW
ncbi:MAG: DSD1 family PLP-dependent enzyme [Pseudomonadales bacterium]